MGRGCKGVLIQSSKKDDKKSWSIPNKDNQVFIVGKRHLANNQTVVDLPEDVLNELRQMNPREVSNILVNMQI